MRRARVWTMTAVLAATVLASCSGGSGDTGGARRATPDATGAVPGPAASSAVSSPSTTRGTEPVPGSAAARFCATGLTVDTTGSVTDETLDEISGVAASRRNPGVWWVLVDSGGPPAVWGIDETGATRGRVELRGATNVDWEDLAVGPGPEAGTSFLFVADIGDNRAERTDVQVYRLPEPDIGAKRAPADVITLRYPDRPHDAEAFLVHPTTGDWYLVTKEHNGPSILFRARAPGAGDTTVVLEQLGSIDVRADLVTGGAFSPDGTAMVLRTYLSVRVFPVVDGDVAAALARPDCRGPRVFDPQGEAITFTADGNAIVTLSEGRNPEVHVIRAH